MSFNKKALPGVMATIFLLAVSATALMANPPVKKDQPNRYQAESEKPKAQNTGPLPFPNLLTLCQNNLKKTREQLLAMQGQVDSLQQQNETLHQEKQALYDQVADLQLKAALPLCSNRSSWIHPTIPTVQCSPYSCGAQPFACHMTCNENLDCANGFVCTASGVCKTPP